MHQEHELLALIRKSDWFMSVLDAAARVSALDWWIGAGVIRDLVWDTKYGTGFVPDRVKDVDLVYFDGADLSPEMDAVIENKLRDVLPGVPWEAKNQAAVHVWYPRKFGVEVEPFGSAVEAVATWPETATSVAVCLRSGELCCAAPLGLGDLLNGIWRRNPSRVSLDEYERRLAMKGPQRRYPGVAVIGAETTRR